MAQTITVNAKTLEQVVSQLDKLTKEVAAIKKQILDQEPINGSDAWWEKEIKEGEEDIKKGNYYELRDENELDDFFKNIHSDVSNEKYHSKIRR